MARIVVVGDDPAHGAVGRLGALATAARLARQRHDVLLVESAAASGPTPALVLAEPASFTLPAAYRDLFRKTGRPMEATVNLVAVEPARRFVWPDGTILDLPTGSRSATLDAFGSAFGAATASAWDELITDAGAIWERLRRDLADDPAGAGDTSAPHRPQSRHGRGRDPYGSLRWFARSRLTDQRARAVLDWYVRAAGADPRSASAATAVLAYTEHAFGSWQVEGGLSRLAAAIAERAALRGATHRRDQVVGVSADGPAGLAVTLADGAIQSAAIVVDATTTGIGSGPRPRTAPAEAVAHLRAQTDAPDLPVETVVLGVADLETVVLRRPDLAGDPDGLTVSWRPPTGIRPEEAPGHLDSVLTALIRRGIPLRVSVDEVTIPPGPGTDQQTGWAGGRLRGRLADRRQRDPARWFVADPLGAAPGRLRVGTSARGAAAVPYLALSAARAAHACGTAARSSAG